MSKIPVKTSVTLFISALRQGGAERVAADLCGHLASKGHDVQLLTLHRQRSDDYPISTDVSRVDLDLLRPRTTLLDGLLGNIRRLQAIRCAIKKRRPTVIVSFLTINNILILIATLGLGIPVIVSERIYPPNTIGPRLWILSRKYIYRLARVVVVQTEPGKQWLEQFTYSKRIVVIPNSISWPPTSYYCEKVPETILPSNSKIVLGVGRYQPQKGFDLLLESFARFASDAPEWCLAIVGHGEDDYLSEQIISLGMQSRVYIIGPVGNIARWYDRADIYVLSSLFEGFPNSLAEAMASGCAVISFNCLTGPSDLIEHEVNGLLAKTGDICELKDSIHRLAIDVTLRKRIGANAESVRYSYSPDIVDAEWERLILEVENN